MANIKCSQNSYYDKLVESCQPCHLRCYKRAPSDCTSYCKTLADRSVSESHIVWIILGVLLFLSALTFTLTLALRTLRKNKSKHLPKNTDVSTGPEQENKRDAHCKDTRVSELLDEVIVNNWEEERNNSGPQYTSCFPVPATEEGATILVTAKTAQLWNYALDSNGDPVLGLWQSVFTA
ncbi:tumor necrosis factor receptor superfamily member 17 [Amia ocellicauda]|uniref:tumor necrosis factor receptor superfamily member 17 n=1 Tax=Amia ocellicauda TaxID=2972642 RepID=UPI0034647A81